MSTSLTLNNLQFVQFSNKTYYCPLLIDSSWTLSSFHLQLKQGNRVEGGGVSSDLMAVAGKTREADGLY